LAKAGRPKTVIREWLSDPYVKEWLQGLSSKTVKTDIINFHFWVKFIGMTPTQMIERRLQDLKSSDPRVRSFFEQKVLEYIGTFNPNEYTVWTIRTKVKSVMSFFSRNRLPLHFKRRELLQAINRNREAKVVQEWIPTNEEVRVLYGLANVRDRALLLMLYQSGLSEADVSALNVQDIPQLYGKTEGHVFFQKQRQKTKMLQRTCISAECMHDLRLYLMERDNPTEGALFVSSKGERLAVRFINTAIKSLVEKAFPERAKEWKTKNLRDAYNDALLRSNIAQEIKDLMMGHKRQGARGSYECSPTTIKEAYKKAFEYLSVNHGTQTRMLNREIKQSILTLTKIIQNQKQTIDGLLEFFQREEQQNCQRYADMINLTDDPEEKQIYQKALELAKKNLEHILKLRQQNT